MNSQEISLPTENSIVGRHQKRNPEFVKMERRMNRVLIFLYRINLLTLIGIGRRIILIHTKGRKTGNELIKPVLYLRFYTGKLTLYSARGRNSDWFKNIFASDNQIIEIQKGFKRIKVRANLIENQEEKFNYLKYWFENYRLAKSIFGYEKAKHGDVFETENFKELVNIIEFIQLIPI